MKIRMETKGNSLKITEMKKGTFLKNLNRIRNEIKSSVRVEIRIEIRIF